MNQLNLYLHIVRKRWLIITAATATAIIIAFIASILTTPVYLTKARFIVSPDPQFFAESDLLRRGLDTLDRDSIIATYAEVFDSSSMRNAARETMGLARGELSGYGVSAVALTNTNVLELSVEGPDPGRAAQLANAIGAESIIFLEDLYVLYNVTILDEAAVPTSPISPVTERNVGVAAILGLAAGLGLALLVHAYEAQQAAENKARADLIQPSPSAD